ESPVGDFHSLAEHEQVEEFFFLGLRQSEGIDLRAARARWGTESVAHWEDVVAELIRDGRLELHNDRIMMPAREYLVSNEIFQEFLLA
ncbi:MAG: hypothetical protein ACM3NO_01265, partial [Deltaproteobacteria bacterium]